MEAWRWREGVLLLMALGYSVGFPGDLGFLVLMVVTMGEWFAREPLWISTSLDRGLVGLIAMALLSALWSPWRESALGAAILLGITSLAVVRAVVLSIRRDPRFVARFLGVWAAGGVLASVVGMRLMGPGLNARAASPFLLGFNTLGTTLAIAAVLVLGLSLNGPRYRRLLWAAACAVVAVGLVLTWSRGAWLGAVLGLGTLLLTTGNRRRWVGLLAAAAVLLVATPIIAPRWQWHAGRLRDVAAAEGRFSRIAIWRVTPRMIADHPVLGTGLATFSRVYERYTGKAPSEIPPHAHNLFLNFAVETGLLGLAALLLFLGAGIGAMVRWYRRSLPGGVDRLLSAAVLAAFVALMGQQVVDATVMSVNVSFGLYALLALGAARERRGSGTPA